MRYIRQDHVKLAAGINRTILLAIAWAIAETGDNGIGCHPGNQTIADELGCNRETVRKHRNRLLETEWFADTGRKVGRVSVWDIRIPDRKPYALERQPKRVNTTGLKRGKAKPAEPVETVSEPSSASPEPRPERSGRAATVPVGTKSAKVKCECDPWVMPMVRNPDCRATKHLF